MTVHQLIYYSRNKMPGDDRAQLTNLRGILSTSQRNNARDGITGYLIFDKSWFVQILEGDRAKVSEAYTRIARDNRHAMSTVMNTRDVAERSFPEWTMGGIMRSVDVQEIYLSHGFGGPVDPTKVKWEKLFALALDLNKFERTRRSAHKQAS
jgi:hypothetical protein